MRPPWDLSRASPLPRPSTDPQCTSPHPAYITVHLPSLPAQIARASCPPPEQIPRECRCEGAEQSRAAPLTLCEVLYCPSNVLLEPNTQALWTSLRVAQSWVFYAQPQQAAWSVSESLGRLVSQRRWRLSEGPLPQVDSPVNRVWALVCWEGGHRALKNGLIKGA